MVSTLDSESQLVAEDGRPVGGWLVVAGSWLARIDTWFTALLTTNHYHVSSH